MIPRHIWLLSCNLHLGFVLQAVPISLEVAQA
eukprot:CAMPEP_0179178898 /NCGR_PEP_ID=MMETSP0796-20121207/88520_1 /TAXON_ID=73915 /ORGANISM="Pyrodinium bahamense, Strain pbaha01" /LENGTH=31 /DNA_ID= /DNA_START= /DNA_END= /DNA_ORIENTATION=